MFLKKRKYISQFFFNQILFINILNEYKFVGKNYKKNFFLFFFYFILGNFNKLESTNYFKNILKKKKKISNKN